MNDHVILHKSIVDDWKFKDESILKFWILLLIEETQAQKDKEGLFAIKSLSRITKKANITRQKAHRILKKMETNGDIEFLSSYFRGSEQKVWNMNGETTAQISINSDQTSGHNAGHFSIYPETIGKAAEIDSNPQEADIISDNFSPRPPGFEEIDWEQVVRENIGGSGGDKTSGLPTEPTIDNEALKPDLPLLGPSSESVHDSAGFSHDLNTEKTTPSTKEEEERALRQHLLRAALKEEVGYLFYDETINGFFNELYKEYDGSPDKELQLAARNNLLRKIHGSFKNTLELRKAELYAENRDNPIILNPNTRILCSKYLDREFLKISKKQIVHYDEKQMIKVDIRGPRNVGDVARQLAGHFAGHKAGQFSIDTKTIDQQVKPDPEQEKTDILADGKPDDFSEELTPTESSPSNNVGIELALKSINEVNTIFNTNISTITLPEHTKNNFVLDKRGCGGEKGNSCQTETPNENVPAEKNSKVAENHSDGRPAFSTKAFKSLPRSKQIQIIGERLSDLAELFPTTDVEFQFDHWKDWMDAKGLSFKDYSAAFRNWLRKSLDFAAKNTSSNPTKIYTEKGAKFVTKEVFTNPAHVPFKKDVPRNPNLKRRPGIGGVE